ncbi:MAG: hypothetical protein ACE5HT_09160 [Gemmatimonadales bacterium]
MNLATPRTGAVLAARLALLALGSPLSAQTFPLTGDRVRVTAPDFGLNNDVRTFLAWRGDTLLLDNGSPVPLEVVTKLEVHRGHRSKAGVGAIVGAIVGVAGGAAFAVNRCSIDDCENFLYAASVFAGATIGGTVGLGVGAGFGSLIRTDRWEESPIDRRHVGATPQHTGRFRVRLSVAF